MAQLTGPGYPYEQLTRALIERIRSGEFPPGSRLPSYRGLATEYDTTQATVSRAFQELSRHCYLRDGKGANFVADELPAEGVNGGHPLEARVEALTAEVREQATQIAKLTADVTALTERFAQSEDHKSR